MNWDRIVHAMEFSALAYREVQPQYPDTMFEIINTPSGVQCYLRKYKNHLLITFRGSNSLQDWETNLTFWKKKIPYDNTVSKIRVHTGFIDAYKGRGVRDKIQAAMSADIDYVGITGHSQGAALAILCAVDLEYNFPQKDYEVIVFGCPRIGNSAFQKSYNKRVPKTVRIENGNDIITKIPFALWGYRHVGAKIHIGFPRIPAVYSAKNHYPHSYYSKLLSP